MLMDEDVSVGYAGDMLWRRPADQNRQYSRSSSRPAVSNPAISSSMPLLPLASLTEQSPNSFGHTNTQAYGKTEVQSE